MNQKPASPAAPRPKAPAPAPRRGFLQAVGALVAGALLPLAPVAAGVYAFFDPLRRKSSLGGFVRVTTLDAVPDDGVPRQFPIVADLVDAWNKFPHAPVGAIYLRQAEGTVSAVSATCPHAGCMVDFESSGGVFRCPCHDSSFQPDGARIDPANCPSPRDLDPLEVEVRQVAGTHEIWVKYENFIAGKPERIPES